MIIESIIKNEMLIYYGGRDIITRPEIGIGKYTKEFYWGFYCTIFPEQAERWALRNIGSSIVNIYKLNIDENLNIKIFPEMNDEWLDFIVNCRNGGNHSYDIVEGPMADDTIYNFIQDYIDGNISKAAFWELAKFRYPTHQISFHTARSLECIKYERSYRSNEK